MRKFLMISAAAFILTACSNADAEKTKVDSNETAEAAAGSDKSYAKKRKFDGEKLKAILDAQPEKTKARYDARNPAKTLKFFGIKPGMKVGEALPGGGKKKWPTEFVSKAAEWAPADGAKISATTFGDAAGDLAGQLDAVLFIRAMHNLSRYEAESQYMTQALATTHALLKPGGVVGVVQHRAPETATDDWAIGTAGYLKQSNVVAAFDAAGFELIKKSGVNANPKDTPSGAAREAIGESNRMTLLFKKR